MTSFYSPSDKTIYNDAYKEDYLKAETWPEDGIEISDEDAQLFNGANQPANSTLEMVDGKLAWILGPGKSDSQRYFDELDALNADYQTKKTSLMDAYLNAMLYDGDTEQTKRNAIYNQLQTLNQQYASDIDALDAKYGV